MKKKHFLYALTILLGLMTQSALCMEDKEESTRKSVITKICHTFDPREYSSSTKKKLLIGTTIAATGAVAGLVYYYTSITEDNEQSYLLNTQGHTNVAQYGSANANIIHQLMKEGLSYVTDSLTGHVYKLQLISSELISPKGEDAIRQAGFLSIPPNPENLVYRSLLQDLNSTVGGPCLWSSQKFWDMCNYYNWFVDDISCVSSSLYESTCDVTYAAIKEFYSKEIRRGGSVYPDKNSPILETLKGIINMKWNITNQ